MKSEMVCESKNNTFSPELSELEIRDMLIRELLPAATGKKHNSVKIVHKRGLDEFDRDVIELLMGDGAKWTIYLNNGGYPL